VVRELRQTLATHRTVAGVPVSKVWLCGGGASVRNLDAYLAEELGVEVEYLRPDHLNLEGIDKLCAVDDSDCGVSWVKALGLALHAHQGGRRGWLNLRRGPFAFKGDFTAMRGKVLQVAAAVIILALLAVGNALVHYFSMRATDQTLDERIKETTQAILGKPYDNVDKALAIINEKINPEETASLPHSTALDGLFEVHNRIPKELKVRFKDINISPARIRVEGFTDTFDSVEKIKAALQEHECFTEVKPGRTRRTRNEDEVEFELTIVNDDKC
jgi:general secretion pathway protein L